MDDRGQHGALAGSHSTQLLKRSVIELTSRHMSGKEDVLVCLCPHVLLSQLHTVGHLHATQS